MLSCFSRARLFATLWTDCSPRGASVHGDSPPRDRTGISGLLHWQADSLPLAPPEKSNRSYLLWDAIKNNVGERSLDVSKDELKREKQVTNRMPSFRSKAIHR